MSQLRAVLICTLLGFLSTVAIFVEATEPASSWPQFRGPAGDGHAVTQGVPLQWSETKGTTWKTAIPGRGWSSPVAEDGQIWMTTAHETEATEEEREKLLIGNTGSQPLSTVSSIKLQAVCVETKSGKLVCEVPLLDIAFPDPIHFLNSFASPTPIIENGRLYCHFGTHGTVCVDTKTQKVVWKSQDLHLKHENGPGGSPILWGNRVIFHCDGSDVQYIAALDKHTGEIAWKTDRSGKMNDNPQLKKSYGTPHIVKIDGTDQLVSPGADWLYFYDPATGQELHKVAYGELGFSIVPRPLVGHGMIYMCTSFMRSQLIAFRYDGVDKPEIAWRYKKGVSNQPSPILVRDRIYFVSDKGGIVTCLNAKTGEKVWTERLGGNYSASPLYADGRIYFSNREGVTSVLEPGERFKLLAKNRLAGGHMASLIPIDGAIFARTEKTLYRLD
jgi:outer membrane protein assembly factor BamB